MRRVEVAGGSEFAIQLSLESQAPSAVKELSFLQELKPRPQLPLAVASLSPDNSDTRVLNVASWNTEIPVFSTIKELNEYLGHCQKKRPKSIVVQAPADPIRYLPGRQAISETVKMGVNGQGKRLWLVSGQPISDEEAVARKKFLQELGLVNVDIRKLKKTGLVYVSGRPEKRRKPINLMESPWVMALRAKIESQYESSGWHVLSGKEVDESLKKCNFAPEAYIRLREGYGFWIQGRCGCLYRINLKGETFLAYHCPDEECQSVPLLKKENKGPVFIGRDIPLSKSCFDCGSTLLMDTVLGRRGKRGQSEVVYNIKCPHCAHSLIGTARYWVNRDQIKFVGKNPRIT